MGKMTAESGGKSVKKFNRVKGIRGENLEGAKILS